MPLNQVEDVWRGTGLTKPFGGLGTPVFGTEKIALEMRAEHARADAVGRRAFASDLGEGHIEGLRTARDTH